MADGYAYHAPGMAIAGREAIGQVFAMLRGAFPDWREDIEDLVAEGDRVVSASPGGGPTRVRSRGCGPRAGR